MYPVFAEKKQLVTILLCNINIPGIMKGLKVRCSSQSRQLSSEAVWDLYGSLQQF